MSARGRVTTRNAERRSGRDRDVEAGEEVLDAGANVVVNGADGVDELAGGGFQRLPGDSGQASPQPLAMTTAAAWTTSSVQGLGYLREMPAPPSAIATTADGFT